MSVEANPVEAFPLPSGEVARSDPNYGEYFSSLQIELGFKETAIAHRIATLALDGDDELFDVLMAQYERYCHDALPRQTDYDYDHESYLKEYRGIKVALSAKYYERSLIDQMPSWTARRLGQSLNLFMEAARDMSRNGEPTTSGYVAELGLMLEKANGVRHSALTPSLFHKAATQRLPQSIFDGIRYSAFNKDSP